jgi:transcription antitermination factor NusG
MSEDDIHRSLSWFALSVKPRFDRAVARTLESKGYETLLPLYRKQHHGTRCSRDSELPLFPGYVCCRFDVRSRQPILMTPGVVEILGTGDVPIPLAEIEVVSLQKAIRAGLSLQPFPFVAAGQRVRIVQGALAGVEGLVMSCKQTLRLVLSISLLQKSVLLEVARDEVTVSGCAGTVPYSTAEGGQS